MAEAGPPDGQRRASSFPDPAERLAAAEDYKNSGNNSYKNKDYRKAVGKYHRALLQLKDMDLAAKRKEMRTAFGLDVGQDGGGKFSTKTSTLPEEVLDKALELEVNCLNNLAACLLQNSEPNYQRVIQYCNEVLDRDCENGKAFYRRGVAQYHLNDHEKAQQSLNAALRITPKDSNIKKYLDMCSIAITKQTQKEKKIYKGMFDKLAAEGETT